ncbi:MAG: hypothetical protein AAF481_15845 [Acidobacteriota bacterium]
MSFDDHRVISFRVLLDEAFKVTRRHLGQLYLPFALPLALAAVSMVALQGWMMQGMTEDYESFNLAFTCGVFGLIFVAALSTGVVYFAMSVAAYDAVAERPVGLWRSYLYLFKPRVFGTALLLGLLLLLSYICCILPLLYVAPLLSFTFGAMIEEDRFGTAAIQRSAQLAGTNPLDNFPHNPLVRAFALLVVGMAISTGLSLLIQLPFEVLRQVLFLRDLDTFGDPMAAFSHPGAVALQLAGSLLGSLASSVLSLYLCFAGAMLFHDTRRRREGADLESALDALEPLAEPPSPPAGPANPPPDRGGGSA